MENPLTIIDMIPSIIQVIEEIFNHIEETATLAVNVFKNIPDMLRTVSIYVNVIPPFIRPFMACGIGFITFKFGLAYSKGSGQ